jgi:uncharacterized protein YgiM (DUF1202 family)
MEVFRVTIIAGGMRMRRFLWLCAVLVLVAAANAGAADKVMSVTVDTTQIRATASYLAKVLATLKYGDKVTILDQPANAKGWAKVLGPDKKTQGWVNLSALTTKDVQLASTTGVQQTASSGDVALAGKGFNSDVEAQYKAEQKLDYTWVDKMQSFAPPPEQVAAFVSAGGLTEQGGAQ